MGGPLLVVPGVEVEAGHDQLDPAGPSWEQILPRYGPLPETCPARPKSHKLSHERCICGYA